MLYLLLEAGSDLYAAETSSVEAVVPCALLKQVPGAPPAVAGILNYRGTQVAVMDCGELLAGKPCAMRCSTRIILYRAEFAGQRRLIGLLAENITRMQRFEESDFKPPAARASEPECAGPVAVLGERLVQRLHPEKAIRADVLETLLAGAAE
jgi:chemotaxis-related protein WspB